MKKTKLLRLSIIVAVILVSLGVLAFIFLNMRTKDASIPTDTTEDLNHNDIQEAESKVTNSPAPEETPNVPDEAKLQFTFKKGKDWDAEGMKCAQFDCVIKNNTQEVEENWELEILVPEGTELMQGWNGEYEIKEDKLIVKPVTYNTQITENGEITLGFILKSIDVFTITTTNIKMGDEDMDKEKEKKGSPAPTVIVDSVTTDSGTTDAVGQLSVKGTKLVNEEEKVIQLKGISTHGIAWYPQYVNRESFQYWKEAGANVIRLAMYSNRADGYQTSIHTKVEEGVKYATELGLYVIIDWHILADGNPRTNQASAEKFFQEMSSKYKDYDNVIYEICNEPNGDVQWERDIKPYAEDIIDTIRKNDKKAIIIVGTPNWSQDVDVVSKNPIKGYENIMYALHFYAGTHKDDLRNKMTKALENGLPIIVSEFGICDASGNGGNDYDEATKWIDLVNQKGVSFIQWNLSNKEESSAFLLPSCKKVSGWQEDDLTDSGKWLLKVLK